MTSWKQRWFCGGLAMILGGCPSFAEADPYLWLEEIDGDKALAWVEARNSATLTKMKADPAYQALYDQALAVLDSDSRIPDVDVQGRFLYNFWKDAHHPRGIYRRTHLEEFRKVSPEWQTVLDIDALSKKEGKTWVFKGMKCLRGSETHCLVFLSEGGGDTVELREFDAEKKAFVTDGFRLPASKMRVGWMDEDTVFVGTDFGEGSLTDSGYPRISKLWRRGTPLTEAKTLLEGSQKSVSVGAFRMRSDEGNVDIVQESTSFWTTVHYQLVDGQLKHLDIPESAVIEGLYRGRLLISLKQDWQLGTTTYREGSVLIADPTALRGGPGKVEVLVEPTERAIVEDVSATERAILVTMLEDVTGRLYRYEQADDGGWKKSLVALPDHGSISVSTIDVDHDAYFVEYEGFTTPPTLFRVSGPDSRVERLKSQEPTFDGRRFEVRQHFATSSDGTRIPYFVVLAKETKMNGKNPTHIFSYGGFRNSLVPSYSGSYEHLSGAYGKLWLERGGVFVLANIRGGGEFGPAWHQAALLENRHKSYEDFEAVAEDLIARKITSPGHLGIEGRSNGGLLVGATLTRRPELYGAVVCGAPLLDMKRYHRLLAGASWMAEYGDPDDPEMWSYIRTYSPYQNVKKEMDYPPVFFYLSTRDDRVHPGHARKMAAKMIDLGYEVAYYENTEGGHHGSSTNEQLARRLALSYTHLWSQLR